MGLGRTATLAPATPRDIREHKRSVDDVKLAACTILNMNEQAEERAEEPSDSGEVFGAVGVSLRWILFAAFTHANIQHLLFMDPKQHHLVADPSTQNVITSQSLQVY